MRRTAKLSTSAALIMEWRRLYPPKRLADVPSFTRRSDLTKLLPRRSIGVELGVAEGKFSFRLLGDRRLAHLFSVDMWAGDRGHTSKQYKGALRRLLPEKERSTAIRLKFDEALDLFPDHYFDFIYVDGYAHTGQEGGNTITTWWPKLKVGGIMAGDDYSPDWPLVVKTVDGFIAHNGLEMFVLKPHSVEDKWSRFPSWVTRKVNDRAVEMPPDPLTLADEAFARGEWATAMAHYEKVDDVQRQLKRAHILSRMITSRLKLAEVETTSKTDVRDVMELLAQSFRCEVATELSGPTATGKIATAFSNSSPPWLSYLRGDQPSGDHSRVEETICGNSANVGVSEMNDLIARCFDNDAISWHWWAAAYARLLQLGYTEAAYSAKTEAAKYLLVKPDEADSSLVAAAKCYLDPPASIEAAGTRSPIDERFARLVDGRSIAVVGPAVNAMRNGATIDSHALVVRTNFLHSNQLLEQGEMLGKRTDIAYYNLEYFWERVEEIEDALGRTPVIAGVFRSAASRRRIASAVPALLSRFAPPLPTVFLGRGFAMRHILDDLLQFNVGRVTCFGADFFLSDTTHAEGYQTARTDVVNAYVWHDPLDTWLTMKRAHETGKILADEVLCKILSLSRSEFLTAVGWRINPGLYDGFDREAILPRANSGHPAVSGESLRI